jgi:O-Antigen ligase
MNAVILIGLLAVDLALFLWALRWPWRGLVALVGLLPLNAFLIYVPARGLNLSDNARVALAAWHDSLALGIVAAAALACLLRLRRGQALPRIDRIDLLVAAVLGLGVVYIFVATHLLTAVYAYRTLYEPIVLMSAVVLLARMEAVPATLPGRAAIAMIVGGVVAALAAWPQVYLGGFAYLDRFYHDVGQVLSPSYMSSFINQPRAVGTFNSPNEYGAYMAIVLAMLVAPGVIKVRPVLRTSGIVAVCLALLLSFSRSGWLSAATMLVVIAFLSRSIWPSRAAIRQRLSDLRFVVPNGAIVLVGLALAGAVVLSSGAPQFLHATLGGSDASADYRPTSVAQGVQQLRAGPLGLGLGMAGPKSTRFGEVGSAPVAASEVWYLTYAMQVGVFGLLLLAALVWALISAFIKRRSLVWDRLAIGVWIGIGIGAVFIPIVDDPAVALPLWVIGALALAQIVLSGHPAEPEGPDVLPVGDGQRR